MKEINVAIAVIQYQQQFLLGFRNASQHQGNRYEFVGGKVEKNETAKQALIREIKEEIGLRLLDEDYNNDSSSNKAIINLLGVITHIYANNNVEEGSEQKIEGEIKDKESAKKVCLHVFRIEITHQQYTQLKKQQLGNEGQKIEWVQKSCLLNNKYKLPDANITILQWLSLPQQICISYDITSNDYDEQALRKNAHNKIQSIDNWVNFYAQHLADKSCVYLRFKQSSIELQSIALTKLLERRADLKLIINRSLALYLYDRAKENRDNNNLHNHVSDNPESLPKILPQQIIAQHLTHAQLMKLCLDEDFVNSKELVNKYGEINGLLAADDINLPITVSCHDELSLKQANLLAHLRIQNQQPAVVGLFLSPVCATNTHLDAEPLGWERFGELASLAELPVIAMGGLEPEDIIKVRHYNGDKIAGRSNFMKTP